MSVEQRLIQEALAERLNNRFKIEDVLFPEQLAFVRDESGFATAVCSRRSGKTVACAADLTDTATQNSSVVCLYITLSRNNAKKIIWPELLRINRIYELGGKPDLTELSLSFPNGSIIYLSGAKDKSEIEKFRGLPIKLCYIDEAQSFKEYIQELIDDVISPALMDYAGRLRLIGTPGPIPAGYFYKCATSTTWTHHAWTFFQNIFITQKSGKTHRELLDRELTRRGVSAEDPSIQREWFGKWVLDTNALVFRYTEAKNDFTELPDIKGDWSYIIGVDIGDTDADAIALIAYHKNHPAAYLVHEDVQAKQGITELAEKLIALVEKYSPDRIVMDTGGLGAKIAKEINSRYGIGVIAAEKTRKFEYIELLNDALRTERFMIKKDSRFAQDAMLVEWDMEKTNADKKKISDRFHSDICDAVLYAFRESLHWLSEPVAEVIKPQTPEWFEREEREMEEAAQNSIIPVDDDPWSRPISDPFD